MNSKTKFSWHLVFLICGAVIWLTACQPQELSTKRQESESVSEKVASAGSADLKAIELPQVEWNAEWEITRKRPGYPLLSSVKHFKIQKPAKEFGAYHHHPLISRFSNRFFTCWSNHPFGEDGPGQQVLFSTSADGMEWSKPKTLFEPTDQINSSTDRGRSLLPAGIIEMDKRVFALCIVNDSVGYGSFDTPVIGEPRSEVKTSDFPKRIRQPQGYLVREIQLDEMRESPKRELQFGPVRWFGHSKPNPADGFPEFIELEDERLKLALQSYLENPKNGLPWDFNRADCEPIAGDGSLLCEPASMKLNDDLTVTYYRDLTGSQKLYARFSRGDGSRSEFFRTPIPDAPSKAVVGRLEYSNSKLGEPRELFALIGNQVVSKRGTRRDPLTIGLSMNGCQFDKAFAIRWRTPKFQVEKQQAEPDGRGRGFQYPDFVVADGCVWVVYSVNKEAIEVSRIPLGELFAAFDHSDKNASEKSR